MARSGKTAQEFIQSSFSPIIATLCSPKVNLAVAKNNLSFVELLQPFASFDWEGQIREPNGTVCTLRNWKVIVRDVNWKPLQPTEARRKLNNAVLHQFNDKTTFLDIDGKKFSIPQSTPWFDAWRETYFEVQFPSDHEFTKHFLACMLIASTLDDNIIDTLNGLNQQFAQLQNVVPPKLPKWFNSNVLKSYVLLHDASLVSQDRAAAIFESMKQMFEASNCYTIVINSRNTTDQLLPMDYWAPFVKGHSDTNNEVISPSAYQPGTPLDQSTGFPGPQLGEDGNTTIPIETAHPLTTIENDLYDNANSLQTHSFSGSSESVSTNKALDLSTEVHGAALSVKDIDGIKKFMHEYTTKSLLPYIEKQIVILTDAVANRKGVSRSLLSATKRWFGTGKTGNNTGNNTVIYSSDCPELQLRRLGDLWFMCGQWTRAFDTYHTAKREFYADGAWLCYAGALEMAALSAFMAGEASRKTHGYMEESIVTYLNTCRMVQYAVRATLLSSTCLGFSGSHGEAAKQLIRMTSEDSDLRSAMLLEQAALCFLAGPGARAMARKYAFHMVLAGHRFSKAGQKKHAYRCYKQAYEVYEGSGWRLSTDHVQFALGRLAGALKRPKEAAQWLAAPLAPSSPQPKAQHHAFLRDFMLAHQQWIETGEIQRELAVLPLPLLELDQTAVLCAGPTPLSSPGRVPASSVTLSDAHIRNNKDEKYWGKMEQMLLQVAKGNLPMIFKPTANLFTILSDSSPTVPQGEPLQICISIKNPLKVSLLLKEVELLWRFTPCDADITSTINNEPSVASGVALENSVIYGEKIKSTVLEGESSQVLTFSITPLQVGQLVIHGLAYQLISCTEENVESSNSISITGKLTLDSAEHRKTNEVSNSYKCLQITVIPCAPCLQMTFSETAPDMMSGEMRSVEVEFRNVGPVDMKNLHLAVSHPDCIQLANANDNRDDFHLLYEEKFNQALDQADDRTARTVAWRRVASRHVSSIKSTLSRAAHYRATLLIRPKKSAEKLYLLVYYEPEGTSNAYRLLRHVFKFNVTEAVDISANPRRNITNVDDRANENLNLVVEIKNVTNEHSPNTNVEVLEASLISQQWKLNDYIAAAKDKNNTLSSREKSHIILKACRIKRNIDNKLEWSSLKVSKGNVDSEPNINVAPYSKFVLDYKTSYVEDEEYFLQDNSKRKGGLLQSMLIVRWKVYQLNGKTSLGQHCLWLDNISKVYTKQGNSLGLDNSIPDIDGSIDVLQSKNKTKKDNVVLFNMEHSPQINHNFKERKLCMIPITINIVNCYTEPVKAFIDMTKKREHMPELGWAGALNQGDGVESTELGVSVSLSALESRKVQVRALCAAPGTYLVGSSFILTSCKTDTQDVASHPCNNSSLLIVQQAA